ncbi:MAG: AMP-binding protein [Actinomycetota bacterium]|nr:AMP-binding protein [Actinomycetota bacterium]
MTSTAYFDIVARFDGDSLWDLFDGDRSRLNIATECVDRHAELGSALFLCKPDGGYEDITFRDLSECSSAFAYELAERGVEKGDRVAVILEPSLGYYAAIFGAIKRGAVAVPMFTLFGEDAVRARVEDCKARVLVVGPDRPDLSSTFAQQLDVIVFDGAFAAGLRRHPAVYVPDTSSKDLAVLQYTSGTNKRTPDAVPHVQRSVVTLMRAALFGLGLRPGDRYFCPSSPGWGHGLWDGAIAPLALGISTGAYVGRFEPERVVDALRDREITNFAAAGTVYRMLRRPEHLGRLPRLEKASYTGEALETDVIDALGRQVDTRICGMYGTTETGVLIANFPGITDYELRSGALGKPLPGLEVLVLDDEGQELPTGEMGEIAVRRSGRWLRTRDRGWTDGDGYFWYGGRADDVVISAGWTISPFEVEEAVMAHPDVVEVAVIGVPDLVRGQVLKAFVVSDAGETNLVEEIQDLVRHRLSAHEYPREIEVVQALPKTPGGKINRRELRERERAMQGSSNTDSRGSVTQSPVASQQQ